MAQLNFDARTVAPSTGFETVPAGWYNVVIDESEMKPTKAGDGSCYLKVRYSILDGQFAGRKIFGNINLQNKNPQATEIGLKQLSAVAHAVGVLMVADSQQLHGIPLKVKIKIRKDKDGEYDDQNEIQQWKNINEQVEGSAPAAGAPVFNGAPSGNAGPFGGAPAQQPWAQPGQTVQQPAQVVQPNPGGMPSWAGAPAATAQPAAQTQAWQQPQTNQAPPATAQPAQQAAPGGFNGQSAVPPWAQKS